MGRFDCNCHRLLNKPSGYIYQIVLTNLFTRLAWRRNRSSLDPRGNEFVRAYHVIAGR